MMSTMLEHWRANTMTKKKIQWTNGRRHPFPSEAELDEGVEAYYKKPAHGNGMSRSSHAPTEYRVKRVHRVA